MDQQTSWYAQLALILLLVGYLLYQTFVQSEVDLQSEYEARFEDRKDIIVDPDGNIVPIDKGTTDRAILRPPEIFTTTKPEDLGLMEWMIYGVMARERALTNIPISVWYENLTKPRTLYSIYSGQLESEMKRTVNANVSNFYDTFGAPILAGGTVLGIFAAKAVFTGALGIGTLLGGPALALFAFVVTYVGTKLFGADVPLKPANP